MTRSFQLAIAATLLFVSSCFSSNASECPEGFFCPEGKYCAAAQRVCIDNLDSCGNGIEDDGEVCDDGNILDGDGCSSDCDSDETCGNDVLDTAVGEVCDDANIEDGDDCSGDCKSTEVCGNGITDEAVNEVCDDGNQDGNDGCNATCTSDETCGNDFTDVLIDDPEFCDDGNNEDGDGCSANCKSGEGCGNGLIDEGEVCDGDGAGNGGETADCDVDCTPVTCGDGIVNATALEACDGDGAGSGGETADCNVDCTVQECGDSKLNTTANEQCDQGMVSTSGCDDDCTFPSCGDGVFNDPAEICDTDGDSVSCDDDCTLPQCGDGHFNDPAEICDDGSNTVSCDVDCTAPACNDGIFNDPAEICDTGGDSLGCDSDCTLPACGDGHFNDPAEICDTGANTVSCDVDCTLPACNDGIFNDPAEICDTGGNSATCDSDCSLPVCGDNLLNTAASEECDDNNNLNNDNCVFANGCKNAICGDGWRDQQPPGTEGCDGNNDGTGGGTNTSICDTDCTTPACGDGIFNDPAEVCDDSNGSNLDDCKNDCTANTCGDGFVDGQGPATEFCDLGSAINGDTECAYGATSDAVPTCTICNGGCTANAGPFTGPYCGDSTTQGGNGESCDDNNAATCGTCNAACTAAITPAKATGSLTMIDGDPLSRDNDRFTLNDGFVSLTFEYDGDNDCCGSSGRIPIDFDNSNPESTPAELAILTRDAINAQFNAGAIKIQASVANPGTSTVVTLTHAFNTSLGNQSVIENVGDSGFTVTGMTGGAAGDCGVGVQCKTDADCNPNFICKAASVGAPLTCQLPTCGDGIVTAALGEECDDGNGSNNDSCPGNCQDAECGDGFEWNSDGGTEQCDDGNPDNDDSCLDTCADATCGDGFVWSTDGGSEVCDDLNNDACGTCSLNCTAAIVPAGASGSFTAAATTDLDDGDTFVIGDGVNPAITFEFDLSGTDDTVGAGNIRVDVDDVGGLTANQVGGRMRTTVDGQTSATFTIAVGGSNALMTLSNTTLTSLGNGTLSSSDPELTFVQMSGGAGGNCGSNVGCNGANICSPTLTCDGVDDRCEP